MRFLCFLFSDETRLALPDDPRASKFVSDSLDYAGGKSITCPHPIVCTSTLNTAGRSRTIGFQLSPASAEAYTWPPVVPK
jgi:hypothetical protein